MPETINYTGELTVLKCWCGIAHAVPSSLRSQQLRKHERGESMSIYCPLGHTHAPAGESKAEKLERQLQWQKEERARVAAERDQAQASARAHKGAATRARKKAAAAVCPVPGCGRSFVQLRRHMAAKHPDYDPEAVPS
jgi:hypothetical protein